MAARTAADLADKTTLELLAVYTVPIPQVASDLSAKDEAIKRAQQFLEYFLSERHYYT